MYEFIVRVVRICTKFDLYSVLPLRNVLALLVLSIACTSLSTVRVLKFYQYTCITTTLLISHYSLVLYANQRRCLLPQCMGLKICQKPILMSVKHFATVLTIILLHLIDILQLISEGRSNLMIKQNHSGFLMKTNHIYGLEGILEELGRKD